MMQRGGFVPAFIMGTLMMQNNGDKFKSNSISLSGRLKPDSELLYIRPHRANQIRRVAGCVGDRSLGRNSVLQRNVL